MQSVARALDLLDVLAAAGEELQLGEIAAAAGLNVSTCHHLLATLVGRGYVGRTSRGRGYVLGTKVLELAARRERQLDVARLALPALRALGRETRETVHLAVLQGHDLVTIAKIDSPQPVRVDTDGVGKSGAAHATATGKAILAWLPEAELERVISARGLPRFTPRTLTTREALVEDLRLVRRHGYALDDEEFQPGVVCVGAAVRNHRGAVIAAVSVSLPAMRVDEAHLGRIRERVRECAAALSEQIGGAAGPAPPNPAEAAAG